MTKNNIVRSRWSMVNVKFFLYHAKTWNKWKQFKKLCKKCNQLNIIDCSTGWKKKNRSWEISSEKINNCKKFEKINVLGIKKIFWENECAIRHNSNSWYRLRLEYTIHLSYYIFLQSTAGANNQRCSFSCLIMESHKTDLSFYCILIINLILTSWISKVTTKNNAELKTYIIGSASLQKETRLESYSVYSVM